MVTLASCNKGSDLHAAKGTVTYNGAPVAGANVTFMHTSGQIAVASTDAQGQFTVMTGANPGAALGEYKVGITKMSDMMTGSASPKAEDMMKMAQERGKPPPKPKSEVPEKYGAPQTSGLTATVTQDESKNVFKFELKD
jgi:hypothetical protein